MPTRPRISVEIKGGGVESIRIVDNGSGIPSDEVVLAFQRHATSKVESPKVPGCHCYSGIPG